MGMGGGTSGKFNLGTILLNQAKDLGLGVVYEQAGSTIGYYGRNVYNKIENKMTNLGLMSSVGFTTGLFIDGNLIHQAIEGNTLAKYLVIGKAIGVGTSIVYDQAKKITKRLKE